MFNWIKLPMLSLAAFFMFCAIAKAIPREKRLLVATMPFVYKANEPAYAGIESGLCDAMSAELVKTEKFRMIERSRIDALMTELKLQDTGLIDPQTPLKVGKQLGAQAVIVGSIVNVSVRDEWRSVKFAEKTTRFAEIEAEARLILVETGELLGSGRAVGKAKSAEKHAFGGKLGELAGKEAVVQKALTGLSKKLAKNLTKTYKP